MQKEAISIKNVHIQDISNIKLETSFVYNSCIDISFYF